MPIPSDVFGGVEILLQPAQFEFLTRPNDYRFGVLNLVPPQPTSSRKISFNILDGNAISPQWVGETEDKPTAVPSASQISVYTKKLAVTLVFSDEQIRDSMNDVVAWSQKSLLPGFGREMSAALLGVRSGTTNVDVFDHNFRADVNGDSAAVIVDQTKRDWLRRAITAASQTLVNRGVNPTAVLLTTGYAFEQLNARAQVDETILAYPDAASMTNGLPIAYDTNLPRSGSGAVIGYVGDWTFAGIRVYEALSVEEAMGAKLADGSIVFKTTNNVRIFVFEMRVAEGVALPQAFVPLKLPA